MKKIYAGIFTLLLLIANTSQSQNWIPDSLFGTNSSLIVNAGGSEEFSNFLLQPDGKIIAGGYNTAATNYYNVMVRFDQCGLLDSSFGTNGIVSHRFDERNKGHAYALQPDGKILCAGIQAPSNAGSAQIPFVARYNSDGSPDTNFAFSGTHALRFDPNSTGTFYSVIYMADGRILCAGFSMGTVYGLGAMRFMSDGSLDSTFSGDGKTVSIINTSYMPARAQLLQNGNIIVAGRYHDGSQAHFAATCFDSTGAVNTSFANAGMLTDTVNLKYIYGDAVIDMQADEKIVMASTREPMTAGIEVIRFNASGILDNTFGTGGRVTLPFPDMDCRGLKIMSNGKIMIMGKTNNVVGGAVQLLSDGTIDSAFATNGYLTVDVNPAGSDYAAGVLEMQYNRLLFGGGDFDENMKRFSTQSNVPHISALWQNGTVLQTTGTGTYQWYFNGSPVIGSTSDTLNATQNGNYTVEITDEFGCTMMSAQFNLTNVGISDISEENIEVAIYPNPVSSELNVQSSTMMNEIRILDVFGKEIFNAQPQTSNFKLQTLNYPKGVYFLEIISGGNMKMHGKFIKQ